MKNKPFSRRRFVAASAAASVDMIAAPFVRTAHAAGRLSVGFWDHWVPGANDTSRALVEEWAEKEKVDVQIDYITSQGEKQRLTIAAGVPGAVWSRHSADGVLVAARLCQPLGAGR